MDAVTAWPPGGPSEPNKNRNYSHTFFLRFPAKLTFRISDSTENAMDGTKALYEHKTDQCNTLTNRQNSSNIKAQRHLKTEIEIILFLNCCADTGEIENRRLGLIRFAFNGSYFSISNISTIPCYKRLWENNPCFRQISVILKYLYNLKNFFGTFFDFKRFLGSKLTFLIWDFFRFVPGIIDAPSSPDPGIGGGGCHISL